MIPSVKEVSIVLSQKNEYSYSLMTVIIIISESSISKYFILAFSRN